MSANFLSTDPHSFAVRVLINCELCARWVLCKYWYFVWPTEEVQVGNACWPQSYSVSSHAPLTCHRPTPSRREYVHQAVAHLMFGNQTRQWANIWPRLFCVSCRPNAGWYIQRVLCCKLYLYLLMNELLEVLVLKLMGSANLNTSRPLQII